MARHADGGGGVGASGSTGLVIVVYGPLHARGEAGGPTEAEASVGVARPASGGAEALGLASVLAGFPEVLLLPLGLLVWLHDRLGEV